jgi:hypothetical protein
MMRACAALLLLLAVTACSDSTRCGVPGVVETCSCGNGMQGARACSLTSDWQACDCSGKISLSKPVMDHMTSGGSGGTQSTAGSGGSGSGGMHPMIGTGGTMQPPVKGDEDSGTEPTGGTGGMGNTMHDAGSGGAASDAGMPPLADPYAACKTATDCVTGAQCLTTTDFPGSICAPPCAQTSDCPKPKGTYEAMLVCVTGFCQLDCTPVLFSPLLTCPIGMTCDAPLIGESYCYVGM